MWDPSWYSQVHPLVTFASAWLHILYIFFKIDVNQIFYVFVILCVICDVFFPFLQTHYTCQSILGDTEMFSSLYFRVRGQWLWAKFWCLIRKKNTHTHTKLNLKVFSVSAPPVPGVGKIIICCFFFGISLAIFSYRMMIVFCFGRELSRSREPCFLTLNVLIKCDLIQRIPGLQTLTSAPNVH